MPELIERENLHATVILKAMGYSVPQLLDLFSMKKKLFILEKTSMKEN
jgi:hypothetical protein